MSKIYHCILCRVWLGMRLQFWFVYMGVTIIASLVYRLF